jgi:hypothetical protein
MRMLNYEANLPLRQVGVLLNREEVEGLIEQLTAVLRAGTGYARLEDPDWGDLDVTLVTDENRPFLTQRMRRLLTHGE